MSETKRNVPKLRFPGFTEDWEQHKLDEILVERSELSTQNKEFPLVSFTVENGVTVKTDRYDREALVTGDKSSKKYKITQFNDIVYNPANLKFGAISRNKYGNAVFSPIYVTLEILSNQFNASFIEYIVTSKPFIDKALRYQQGTVYERQSVNVESFLLQAISVPTYDEQIKISSLLESLDNLITLHQRKLENLKLKKKALLQKLFPKNGEQFPELRFPGFTDAWEQRKLGEVVERVSCTSEDSEIPQVEYEDIISGEGRLNKDITKKLSNKKGILFRKGDVLYGKLRPYLKNWLLPDFSGKAVGDFWVLRSEKVQSSFLYNLIQSNRFDLASNQSTGTKMPRADWNLVANTEFPIPVSIEEQISIGNIFKLLNNSITLHQRKLEHLQLQKKALLQQMFV